MYLEANFDDSEYITQLPLTEEDYAVIINNDYNLDYVNLINEGEISEKDAEYVKDFINETYDLVSVNNISYKIEGWGKEDIKVFISMIKGNETNIEKLEWTQDEYYEFVGKYI